MLRPGRSRHHRIRHLRSQLSKLWGNRGPRPADRTDAELLAATADDPEAFGILYRRHVRAVLAYLLHRTRRPDLAADLTAETFAAALEGAARFRPPDDSGSGRAWLYGIAAHKVADSARRGRVADDARRRLGLPPWELTDEELERAEELADARRMAASLDELVAGLPPDQRRAVEARIVEERPYAEIAEELDCSQAVVRQRVSRGLIALRQGLERSR